MKVLLDTNVLLWWLADSPRLGTEARSLIADPDREILVSVVSLWEVVIKTRIGKLQVDFGEMDEAIDNEGFRRLAIVSGHLKALLALPAHHRDPFDHLLMAQAIGEDAIFLTGDQQARAYPVRVAPSV